MGLSDPYAWLENLDSEQTKLFIKRHNERLKRFLGGLPDKLFEEVMKYYDVPYVLDYAPTRNGVYILVRSGKDYTIRFIDAGGVEDIVSSRNIGEDVVITNIYSEPSGKLLAFFYSVGGSDEGVLRIIDTSTRELVDEVRGRVGSLVWLNEDTYYYVRFYASGKTPDGVDAPAERVFLRRLGGSEEMVFGAGLGTNHMITLTRFWGSNEVFATISYGWRSSRILRGPLAEPSKWSPVYDGGEYRAYPVGHVGDASFVLSYDGGGLGRILAIRGDRVEEVVAERPREPLEEALVVNDAIYAVYLVNASSIIRVYTLDGALVHEYRPSKPSTIRDLWFSPWGGVLFLSSGFEHPPLLGELRGKSFRKIYEPGASLSLDVREEWVRSSDGTLVHVFIVTKAGARPRRAIVYGYGGFAVSVTPFYVGWIAPFLERGGAFVIANLRGGGEYGEKWHREGMLEKKMNVFNDYQAVLRHVRGKGWRTIGWGVSNGGLLVAVAVTRYPELLDAALIGYPLTDMLRFHKLYVGRLWVTEYGDPDNPRDREYLAKYSPYHNIVEGKHYPPTLVYTGIHDDRVHPGHALKFVARLEEIGAPVYLRVETSSGHRGASPETRAREYADLLAFVEKTVPP